MDLTLLARLIWTGPEKHTGHVSVKKPPFLKKPQFLKKFVSISCCYCNFLFYRFRNEKPIPQARSSVRTRRRPHRNSNDAMATNSCTQSDHPSHTQRHMTKVDSDSEISDDQPIARKTRSSRRKSRSQSPEFTKEPKRRRYVLRERQNNEFD